MDIAAIFAPSRCLSCRAAGPVLCAACRAGLVVLDGARCRRCGAPTARAVEGCRECAGRRLAFATATAAVSHEGPAARLVSAWKDRGLVRAGDVLATIVLATVEPPAVDAIVPVPAVGDRARWRGVDGPRQLAEACARAWRLPLLDCLRRTQATPQRGLTTAARRSNARRSFVACASAPSRVVLVDDVYTTGATASACATALRRAGAREVAVVVAARAVRRR